MELYKAEECTVFMYAERDPICAAVNQMIPAFDPRRSRLTVHR